MSLIYSQHTKLSVQFMKIFIISLITDVEEKENLNED